MKVPVLYRARRAFFILAAALIVILWCSFSVGQKDLPLPGRIAATILVTVGLMAVPAWLYEMMYLKKRYRPERGLRTEQEDAQIRETLSRMQTLINAIVMFQRDCGTQPSNSEGLRSLMGNPGIQKWRGPYLAKNAPIVDAWGTPFHYHSQDSDSFSLVSAGPGRVLGDGDDIKIS